MPSPISKSPFRCPRCGFVQLEPPHLISTCCRGCGTFYEVPRPGAAPQSARLPTISFGGSGVREKPSRGVFCHRCGTTHQVASQARTTICPGCQNAIELVDLEFDTSSSRAVDTRGQVLVGPSAHLSHSWLVCGSCRIEGRVSGPLRAEKEVVLASRSDMACQILAPRVVIDRTHVGSIHPEIDTDELVIRGRLQAAIRCRGRVHITRSGVFTGTLIARAVSVDRGGRLSADCRIETANLLEARQRSPVSCAKTFGPLSPSHLTPHPA